MVEIVEDKTVLHGEAEALDAAAQETRSESLTLFSNTNLGNVNLNRLIGSEDVVEGDKWVAELEGLPDQLHNIEIVVLLFCFQEVFVKAGHGQESLA